jgi:CheY-like chemotaxis protein
MSPTSIEQDDRRHSARLKDLGHHSLYRSRPSRIPVQHLRFAKDEFYSGIVLIVLSQLLVIGIRAVGGYRPVAWFEIRIMALQIGAVPTAEEALRILEKTVPTLTIIDLALPGMDGWTMLSEIRRGGAVRDVPCVAITAHHTAEVAREAIEAGFDAYFAKPLDATSFVRELAGIVEP